MLTVLFILLLIGVFGGFGYTYTRPEPNNLIGAVLLVLLILILVGALGPWGPWHW